jgi:hypothetical protein
MVTIFCFSMRYGFCHIMGMHPFSSMVGKLHDAIEKLGPHSATFRAIIYLDLNMCDSVLFNGIQTIPPVG